ncbi:MAG: glycosyltransferase family 2 protein [Bacteroidales bacterium]|nr:glycosyltransferase family 2 protein [Bacteroidales bacterium]
MIDCFIPFGTKEETKRTVETLSLSPLVNQIFLLASSENQHIDGTTLLLTDSIQSSKSVSLIAEHANSEYALIYTKTTALTLGYFALNRMVQIAIDSGAGMLYSDYRQMVEGKTQAVPLIDYQEGSVRDDFNFGSLMLYYTDIVKHVTVNKLEDYKFAGLYDLRLKVSQHTSLVHLNEFLYTEEELDNRLSGEKQFDYVDPRNRAVQVEYEVACTDHLKEIGAYLFPDFESVSFESEPFEFEASIIIPVRDRVNTVEDAAQSALSQECSFKFNVIVIDNHSTDGTTDILKRLSADERLIHLIPERNDLGIGGCWNYGVHHAKCGKFAVQLDSDDVYSSPETLQKIVDAFYEQNCAMVVGTYRMTNFKMEEIPPGIIDHREWTPENGRNNALRINGLGAPRAFFTPMLREINVPNTSYGEDYALGLNFSRKYQIGRIYDVLYLCRRWDGNSDASLDIAKLNANNSYKDKIRCIEIAARQRLNML